MAGTIRWGILGTGAIARKFAVGLTALRDAKLVAVGSRAQQTADAFANQFDVPRRHASYEALAGDEQVDAIYVATPHPMHMDNTILCLRAGKAVLCEKPFAINVRQARRMVAVARRRKVLLMEAMWSRFLPTLCHVRKLLAGGALGELRMVMADFAFRGGWNPKGRLLNPALGGGGLLDVGVYTVSLASMVLGRATRVAGLAEIGRTGVDEQAGMVLGYRGGRLAVLTTGVRTLTPMEATLIGTEGRIQLHSPWWKGTKMTVTRNAKATEVLDLPYKGNGYNFEAAEIGRCLRRQRTESDVMPLRESLEIMKTLDDLRALWGLKYPME